MRPLLLFLLLTISMPAICRPDSLFAQANRLYRQQEYKQAAAIYQLLIDSGYQVPDLYFNAGNAYYKSNRTGMAIYSYEKALRLKPGDEATEHNLAMVNQRVDNIQALPKLFFERWWMQWEQVHTAAGWAIGSIVLFWLLLAAFVAYRYMPGFRQVRLRWGIPVIAAIFAAYFGMAAWMQYKAFNSNTAIVVQADGKVKSAPDEGSKDLFETKEGAKVEILDATKDYCKVQLADGKMGWIATGAIKKL